MIHQVVEYWVDDGTPKLEDIIQAIQKSKEHQCHVKLCWKGPGYKYYGDTYSRTVHSDSNAQEVFSSLPKIYGI